MSAKISVVEDNPDNRMLVEAMLEDDFEVSLFEDGPAALEGIASTNTDLVLLDISLPGMDGPVVLEKLKEKKELKKIPVIALTAHAMAGDREKYLAMGFDDYVSKPIVDPEHLIVPIKKLLARDDVA